VKPAYFIDGLSMLHTRLGSPSWYWPTVMFILFVVLPLLASAVEQA
jgi:hypothetical protein